MELLIVLLVVVVMGTPIAAVVAVLRTSDQAKELERLRSEVRALRRWVGKLAAESRLRPPPQEEHRVPSAPRPPMVEIGVAEGGREEATHPVAEEPGEGAEAPVALPTARPPAPPPPEPVRVVTEPAPTSLEIEARIGTTWVLRIGLASLAVALALFARSVLPQLSATAKVALAYTLAVGLFACGRFFEGRLARFARPVMAAGLTFGFFVAFAAHFIPAMQAVSLAVSMGWMFISMLTVLAFAERWRSEGVAILALLLGYLAALVAIGGAPIQSLALIAFMGLTGMILTLRHGWTRLGLVAVSATYASHVIWALSGGSAVVGDVAFRLNLIFLALYYTTFLLGDLLYWRRAWAGVLPGIEEEAGGGAIDVASRLRSRQLGPANLVLFASVASFLFILSGAAWDTLEWYYLTLGALQGGIAWYYWRVEQPDYRFYPVFGTVLWTLGLFAALEGLVLNLVLSAQALLLLLAGRQTRLFTFHVLAQSALAVAFLHYLAFPEPQGPRYAILLGGLGIAAVYLVKAGLEEVWYPIPGRAVDGVESGSASDPTRQDGAVGGLLASVAPFLAPVHAVLGGLIIVREILRAAGPTAAAGLGIAAAMALLTGIVLARRRPALLLSVLSLAAGGCYLALGDGPPAPIVGVALASVLVGWAFAARVASVPEHVLAPFGWAQAQGLAVIATMGLLLLAPGTEFSPAWYAAGLAVAAVLLAHQEGMRSLERRGLPTALPWGADRPRWLGRWVCGGAGVFLAAITIQRFASDPEVAAGIAEGLRPPWAVVSVAGWAALIAAAAGWRRSARLLLGACALLGWGYAGLALAAPSAIWDAAIGTLWIGSFAAAVPLVLALGTDRAVSGGPGEGEPGSPGEVGVPDGSLWVIYGLYGVAFLLVADVARTHLPGEWWMVPPAVLGLALTVARPRLGTAWAAAAVAGGLLLLHGTFLAGFEMGQTAGVALLPVLVVGAFTLAVERTLPADPPIPLQSSAWEGSRWILVGAAALSSMMAVRFSTAFGGEWATAGWAVLAALLMTAGFALRLSSYRRIGLGMLGACLVRIVVVDIQGLSDIARIGAFFVLGLALVAVGWLYTRYSEELKGWL